MACRPLDTTQKAKLLQKTETKSQPGTFGRRAITLLQRVDAVQNRGSLKTSLKSSDLWEVRRQSFGPAHDTDPKLNSESQPAQFRFQSRPTSNC